MSELKAVNGTNTWITELPVSEGGTGQSAASLVSRSGWGNGCGNDKFLASKGICENPLPPTNGGVGTDPSVGIGVLISVMVISVLIGFAFGLLVGKHT